MSLSVLNALKSRHSTRAFLDRPVDKHIIEDILEHARWAPSGANLQPWKVAVISGEKKKKLSSAMISANQSGQLAEPELAYYPLDWFEPYKTRRFETGMALYQALNIQREDRTRRQQQWQANYNFFGAPTGLIFLADKRLGDGCRVDMGIFIQSVMLAALPFGLATCPQAALADYPHIVRQHLSLSDDLSIICGMALGYEDVNHPVNNYRIERETVGNFTIWYE